MVDGRQPHDAPCGRHAVTKLQSVQVRVHAVQAALHAAPASACSSPTHITSRQTPGHQTLSQVQIQTQSVSARPPLRFKSTFRHGTQESVNPADPTCEHHVVQGAQRVLQHRFQGCLAHECNQRLHPSSLPDRAPAASQACSSDNTGWCSVRLAISICSGCGCKPRPEQL